MISEEYFSEMEQEWNDLLVSSGAGNIFLTWDWLYNWWKYFKDPHKKLFIVGSRNLDGTLVGVLPCYKQEQKRSFMPGSIRFLGSEIVCSEYMDLILLQGFELEIVQGMMNFILDNNHSIRELHLTDVGKNSNMVKFGLDFLEKANSRYLTRKGQTCPYMCLPETVDEFHGSLSQNMRSNIRRKYKNVFKNESAKIRLVEKESEIQESFNTLFSLHQERWASRGETGAFSTEALRKFHLDVGTSMLRKGWLKLYFLEIDSKTVASFYCFEFGGKYFYYQGGYDRSKEQLSPGLVLMGKIIEDAIIEGNTEFDFLRGVENYKWRWTKKYRETVDIYAYPATAYGTMFYNIQWLRGFAKNIKGNLLQDEEKKTLFTSGLQE